MSTSLRISDLSFKLRRSSSRKTVGITVDRDGSLVLSAPIGCPLTKLEDAANKKRFWIYQKLAEKELLFSRPRAREYVSGQGFHYLGRSFRLRLTDDSKAPPVTMSRGHFLLRRDHRQNAGEYFIRWYIKHGEPWLRRRVGLLADRVGVKVGQVRVRDLGFRWGSCSSNGDINFNWRTLQLRKSVV